MKRYFLIFATASMALALNTSLLNAQTATPDAKEQTNTAVPPAAPVPQPHTRAAPPPNPFGDINTEENKPPEDHFLQDFINMLFSLGILVGAILLISWVLKKFLNTRIQTMNTTSSIKIVERRPLTPKTVIYLLEINNRSIVIADHTHGVTKLSESRAEETEQQEEVVKEVPEKSSAFGQILKDKMSKDANPY